MKLRVMLLAALWLSPTAVSAATPCAKQVPFGIAAKRQPSGSLVARLLPAKVGRFTRDGVRPDAAVPSNEDFNLTYRAGKDSIFIGLSRPGSDADLKEAIRTSRQDVHSDKSIDRRGEIYCIASEPFFYKIPDFIAWTRGDYFFYADASSPAVLTEFMAAFPY